MTVGNDREAPPVSWDTLWAGTCAPLKAGLYLVATPLGNLTDITLRALQTLASADIIACEDTRRTQKLLNHYRLPSKPYIVYTDKSFERTRHKIIHHIQQGRSVVLVSDAGMPLISDPGFKLVRACYQAQVCVTAIPGASAVLTGVVLSGLPTDRFFFQGFLPRKGGQKLLEQVGGLQASLVFFESALRLNKTLQRCYQALGDRPVVILREMTKRFEQRHTFSLKAFTETEVKPAWKGEVTVVIGCSPDKSSLQPRPVSEMDLLQTL